MQLSEMLAKESVELIYSGSESGCRCGCQGKYHEPGTRGFKINWNKAMKLNPEVVVIGDDYYKSLANSDEFIGKAYKTETSPWIDVNLGNNRTITFYIVVCK